MYTFVRWFKVLGPIVFIFWVISKPVEAAQGVTAAAHGLGEAATAVTTFLSSIG